MSSAPINITEDKIIKLKNYINEFFHCIDANGNVDLVKAQRNVTYSIGEFHTEINGLLMQEKQRYAQIEGSLKKLRATALHNLKSNRIPYDLNEQGYITMVDGSEDVIKKEIELKQQKSYVDFLSATLSQVSYYANGVKSLIEIEKIKLGMF